VILSSARNSSITMNSKHEPTSRGRPIQHRRIEKILIAVLFGIIVAQHCGWSAVSFWDQLRQVDDPTPIHEGVENACTAEDMPWCEVELRTHRW
jgi:hypothetical protein